MSASFLNGHDSHEGVYAYHAKKSDRKKSDFNDRGWNVCIKRLWNCSYRDGERITIKIIHHFPK